MYTTRMANIKKVKLSGLSSGQNPREHLENHRERGPAKLSFTLEDVSREASVVIQHARAKFARWTSADLPKLAAFLTTTFARAAQPLSNDQLREVFGERFPLWDKRFPRWQLFRCGFPACGNVLVESRLCEEHGGLNTLRLGSHGDRPLRVQIRIAGDWVPFTRAAAGFPSKPVWHADDNLYNDSFANLRTWVLEPPGPQSENSPVLSSVSSSPGTDGP